MSTEIVFFGIKINIFSDYENTFFFNIPVKSSLRASSGFLTVASLRTEFLWNKIPTSFSSSNQAERLRVFIP